MLLHIEKKKKMFWIEPLIKLVPHSSVYMRKISEK